MRRIFTLAAACFVLATQAQSVSNASSQVKMTLSKVSETDALLEVTNLQGCAVDIEATSLGFYNESKYTPGQTKAFPVTLTYTTFFAKPLKECGNGLTTCPTWVAFTSQTLPVSFGRLTGAWRGDSVTVDVRVDLSATKWLMVQQSYDGADWVAIERDFTPALHPDHQYRLCVPLKTGDVEGVHYILLNKYLRVSGGVQLRKPIAGAVYTGLKKLYLRLVHVDTNGWYSYSPVLALNKQ